MIPTSAFKLLKRLWGQWLCLTGCVLPMWGQTELWSLTIHDSVWWVGKLPIEMADGYARLAPCGCKVWSTARERTLYGIPGKPEVNEADWQVQMGTGILANVLGCGPRQFLSTSGMAQLGDNDVLSWIILPRTRKIVAVCP